MRCRQSKGFWARGQWALEFWVKLGLGLIGFRVFGLVVRASDLVSVWVFRTIGFLANWVEKLVLGREVMGWHRVVGCLVGCIVLG